MKFKKGDNVIVLDKIHTPNDLIGQIVKIIGKFENDKSYWCETKQRKRYWLYESNLELVKNHKRKERKRRKIEKLQAELRAIK